MSRRIPSRRPAIIRVTIEKVVPLTGTANGESGETLRFEGWLGLFGVLSELICGADHADGRREAHESDPSGDRPL